MACLLGGTFKAGSALVDNASPPHVVTVAPFYLDLREASTVSVQGDRLVIEVWTAQGGTRTIRRA